MLFVLLLLLFNIGCIVAYTFLRGREAKKTRGCLKRIQIVVENQASSGHYQYEEVTNEGFLPANQFALIEIS